MRHAVVYPPLTRLITPAKKNRTSIRNIPLTDSERAFLLHRLLEVSDVVEAITHRIPETVMRQAWDRKFVVGHAWSMIEALRTKTRLFIMSRCHERLLIEALEGNRYFVRPQGDRRLNLGHIRQAEALRIKVEQALGRKIKRFQIGPDR